VSASEPPDVERLRAALASLPEDARTPADAERIFTALHGEMSQEEREAIIEELVTNPDAAHVWRLAMELTPEPAPDEHVVAPQKKYGWAVWLPVAASVLLAIGIGWQLFNPWRVTVTPVYRTIDQRSIRSEVPEGVPLSRANPVLRWSAVEGARYRVRVLTSGLEPVEEAEDLTVPEYRLSPTALARVPSGGQLLWQVEARVPGSPGVASPTFSARLE
jgi:hypothetical protein